MKKICLPVSALLFLVFAGACTSSGKVPAYHDLGVLTVTQRGIVPIAAFSAIGDLENLKTALNDGLDNGMTVNEIKEVLVQVYAYAGFPRSLNAINTFIAVIEEREKKGIKDPTGEAGIPLGADVIKYEYGERVQTELMGGPNRAAYNAFTPAIDAFLKEHLFADIFARGVLSFQDRQTVTVSMLSVIPGLNNQLRGHFNVSMNIGLTEAQLRAVIAVLETKFGKKTANNANEILNGVIKSRNAVSQ